MRNLKRALSLALAFVMVMSLMIVGTSAKSYTDSDKIENQAAVEVLGEIGVMVGNDDGTFAPDRVVTRAEMAVILTRILYGNNLNVDQFKGLNTFTDVPDWAEGYVNLCASLDIIAGRGNGIFDPDATVTTAEAALMLTRALGYFKNNAEFGNDWALAAVKRATQAGIIGGDMVLQANEGLTRDDVAQMTFNTLTNAVPVQYNELLDVYYNENKGITYALTFYYTDTLGYKNFDLVYRTGDEGDYGRPSTTWGIGSYRANTNTPGGNDDYGLNEDGSLKPELVKMTSDDEIITVAETPDLVYTSGTKENVIYKAVGKSVVDEYSWDAYIDGAEQENPVIPANDRDTTYTYTNKGAVTEVYVDDTNEEVTVVKINYYMGEITDIREDDNGEYATVRMLSNASQTNPIDERNIYCEGFAEDDYVVFTVDVDDDGDSFVATIAEPETAEGTVTRVSENSDPEGNQGSYVKLDDGSQHSYSAYTASDLDDMNDVHPTLDVEYRLYLDPNGYVIGFIALDNYYDNYLYVEEADSYLGTIEAKVVFTDGTSKVVTIDDEYIDLNSDRADIAAPNDIATPNDLEGNVYAWTEADGVYTLRQVLNYGAARPVDNNYKDTQDNAVSVTGGASYSIQNGVAYIKIDGTRYIVDEDTAFIDTDEQILYTGYENVPDYIDDADDHVKFWAIDSNGDLVLDNVFIYSGEASNDNKTYFYVADASDFETYDKNQMYKEHNLYIDGEKSTLVFTQAAHNDVNAQGLYRVERTNGEGVVTEVIPVGGFKAPQVVGTRSFSLGATEADQWVTNDDTIFVVVTRDLKDDGMTYKTPVVTLGDLRDMKDNDDYAIRVVVAKPDDSDEPAELVYIVKSEIATYDNTITFEGDNFALTNVTGGIDAGDSILINDNQTAKFEVEVDAGYKLVSVVVNGEELTAVDGVYTIKNVTKNMTVTVNVAEKADTKVTVVVNDYDLIVTPADADIFDVISAVEDALAEAGYTDVKPELNLDNTIKNFTAVKNGLTFTFDLRSADDADDSLAAPEDSEALIEAINDPEVTQITLPAGEFDLASLTIDDANRELTIVGVPGKTVIKSTSTIGVNPYADGVVLNISGVTFESDGGQLAIQNQHSDACTVNINNCKFIGYGTAIQLRNFSGSVTNCVFDSTAVDISIQSTTGKVLVSGNTYTEGKPENIGAVVDYKDDIVIEDSNAVVVWYNADGSVAE